MKKTRFPVFATIFTLLAIALLCGLGKWQLDRLAWKTEMLQRIDAEYKKDAANIILSPGDLDKDFDYKRGTVQGVYDYSHQVKVGTRFFETFPGFYVLTPLRMADGSYVLINRGWVPQDWNAADEIVKGPGETISATGLARKPKDRNPFTPPNAPAKNQWFSSEPSEIAAAGGLAPVHPYVLYLEGEQSEIYPVPIGGRPQIDNNHLQYAIYWFLMAGILAIIYALRFLRKKKPYA